MDSFWGNIFKGRAGGNEGMREILKKIPIFEDLTHRDCSHIERILHRRDYGADETIFRQGSPGFGMYIIEKGIVSIVSEPSQKVIAELQEGDFFGELALLDDSPRSATALAKIPCTMICFFQSDLLDLLSRNPQVGVKILFRLARIIGERLKRADKELRSLDVAP